MSDDTPPQLVYDDDCGFCTRWAEFAAERGSFDLVGFSALPPDLRARLPDDYESCAHLVTDDAVYSCGAAIEETAIRLRTPERHLAHAFRRLPGSERVREPAYRFVADRRSWLGRFVRREPPARRESNRPDDR